MMYVKNQANTLSFEDGGITASDQQDCTGVQSLDVNGVACAGLRNWSGVLDLEGPYHKGLGFCRELAHHVVKWLYGLTNKWDAPE